MLYAFLWKRLERDHRIFKNMSRIMEEIFETIVRAISEWVSTMDGFKGISLDDINRSWVAILEGKRRFKPISWICWCPKT